MKHKRLYLVGGPGGVGKTTLAASLGIALAQQGHRTVVLTVDPAKRLAQALGFTGFDSELQKIDVGGGELWATMLDTDHYFDRVISKFATSPEQRDRVLAHPLYKTMVENLGGSHEYAAMERLLEFVKDPRYDKIVVDTPPSDNAAELFEAPQRMADFMDNSVLKWFQGGGKLYLQLFKAGTKVAMGALKLIFGAEFLDSLGSFLADLEGMQAGFQKRNLEVLETLRSDQTSFVMVSVPSEARAEDCARFREMLKEKNIPLDRLVLNRLEPLPPEAPMDLPAGAKRLWEYQKSLHTQQKAWADAMEGAAPCETRRLYEKHGPLHDVANLSELGRLLLN
ncbi:AAA family ATPase [bacterium]|nr:AAA family ATPase [bacterium]